MQNAMAAQILKEERERDVTKTPEQNIADMRQRIELQQRYVQMLNKDK